MHGNKNISCPVKLALHQMQSLDSVNPPGMCLKLSPKIFHDRELGTASDKDVWESLIYSTFFPPAIPLHLSFQ
jgi:hypothetical protein